MNMNNKDLDKFARAKLVKQRFTYTGWQIKGGKLIAKCNLAEALGEVPVDLPEEIYMNDRTLTHMAKTAVRKLWPRLVDWVLIGDHKLLIHSKDGEGTRGSVTADLPRDEPVAPPVVDDEAGEGNA